MLDDDRPPASPSWRSMATTVALGCVYVAYPFAVYTAYSTLSTRGLGLALLAAYGFTALLRGGASTEMWALAMRFAPLAVLAMVAVIFDNHRILMMLPMLASGYLLFTFSATLRSGPPMIERFARAADGDLPDFTLGYCRRVTILWCGFLATNTALTAGLTFWAPIEWWALYTGAIFYVAMGSLVVGEFVFRKWWFRRYGPGVIDRVFARIFPPEATPRGRRSLAHQGKTIGAAPVPANPRERS